MKRALAWACVLLVSCAPVAEPASPGSVARQNAPITLKKYVGDLVLAEVQIDGVPARLLLDTGGGLTLLTPNLAQRTSCRPHGLLVTHRMTGEPVKFQKCLPVKLTVGTYSKTITPGVFDINKLLPAGLPPIDGVLSLDSFEGEVIRLSLAEGTISFPRRLSAQELGWRGRLRRRHELPGSDLTVFVQVPALVGSLNLLLDSGNLEEVLLSSAATAQLAPDGVYKPGTLHTAKLQIHDGPPESVTFRVKDLEIDGALNAKLIRRFAITLDLRQGAIWFRPVANGAEQPRPTASGSSPRLARPSAISLAPTAANAPRPARRAAAIGGPASLAFGHPVERGRGLHHLPGTNRIALLEQGRERSASAGGDRVLERLGQIGEGDTGVDRLDVTQQLIAEPARSRL